MLKLLFLILNFTLFYCFAQADTVYLKSGKVIEANILEENADYIKIDFNGNPLYYQKKYVGKIERSAPLKDVHPGVEIKNNEFAPEDYFKKGLEEAIGGDFLRAREEFNRGLIKNNGDYNITAALNLLDELDSGKINREYTLDLFNGLFNMLRNDYKQAILCFKRVLEVKSDDIDVLYNLGVCYYSLDNFEQAIVTFKNILNIKPDDPEVYGLLGNAYYLAGDSQKARESFVLAKELFLKTQDTASANEIEALLSRIFKDQSPKKN